MNWSKLGKAALFSSILYVVAGQTVQAEEKQTFLLEEEADTAEYVEKLEHQYPTAEITAIEELQLIQIKAEQTKDVDVIRTTLAAATAHEGDLLKVIVENTPIPVQENNLIVQDSSEKFNWAYKRVTDHHMSYPNIKNQQNIRIGLIDSGIDVTHPLLKANIEGGKSFVEGDPALTDDFGHGTSVAGVIKTIAPNVKIVPYKVIGAMDGESIWTLQAIVEAVKDEADIINLSLGTYKSAADEDERLTAIAYERAADYAKKHKIPVVASSGNEGYNLDRLAEQQLYHLPGGLEDVITVGSTIKDQSLAYYSNYGSEIDLVAPTGDFGETYLSKGEINVTSMMITAFPTTKENTFIDKAVGLPEGYTLSFGTSLAAPQVTAAIALLKAQDRSRNAHPNKYENQLYKAATDLGRKGKDASFGHGELNIHRLLK